MDIEEIRKIALAFPGSSEAPHFEKSSFRVGTKIFATVPEDQLHFNVLLDEAEARASVAECPEACAELWWGKRICGVTVHLPAASGDLVAELLETAWRDTASKKILRALEDGPALNNL